MRDIPKIISRGRVMPPAYFLAACITMIALDLLVPVLEIIPAPYAYSGGVLIAAGLIVAATAFRQFTATGTTVKPFETSTALVESGTFAVSRNPMYLGMVSVLIGLAVVMGSLSPVIVIPVFVWLITMRFIVPEEQALEGRFGSIYRAYKARVRRWI